MREGVKWAVRVSEEPKAGSSMHLNRKAAIVCSLKCRQPQFTCQAGTIADSSLTPSVALLVHPRGTTHYIMDCHEFTGLQNDAGESRPGYL